jgi:hypothetical protein
MNDEEFCSQSRHQARTPVHSYYTRQGLICMQSVRFRTSIALYVAKRTTKVVFWTVATTATYLRMSFEITYVALSPKMSIFQRTF